MSKPTRRVRNWNYTEASRVLPYLRSVLRCLRENFIRIWHLYRVAGGDVDHPDYCISIRFLADEGRSILNELARMGVIAYQSPLRGIALFPFVAHEGKARKRDAYFVYKDSREEIDSFIFADELSVYADLYGYERPIPQEWKTPGVIPRLE